jgi:hypothetical protein
MVVFKASVLSAGLLLAFSLSAQAASDPLQLAQANPAPGQSYARLPGPKVGPDNWIPAPASAGVAQSPERYPGPKIGPSSWIPGSTHTPPANAAADRASHPYTGHGFGPSPN